MRISNQAFFSFQENNMDSLSRMNQQSLEAKQTKAVAQEFESLFVEMMFKEMRKNLSKNGLSGSNSPESDFFNDMLYTEYSKISVKQEGFGIAKIIEESLRHS